MAPTFDVRVSFFKLKVEYRGLKDLDKINYTINKKIFYGCKKSFGRLEASLSKRA